MSCVQDTCIVQNVQLDIVSRKCVVMAAIWSDPTYSALREPVKRPLVNPEFKVAFDVNCLTMNIGFEAPKKQVQTTSPWRVSSISHKWPMSYGLF